jgi:DNA-binding MarR family transcriptional regulator
MLPILISIAMPNIFDPQQQSDHPASKLLFAFDRIAEVIRVQLWEKATSLKLTPLQIKTLLFLEGHQKDGLNNVSALAKEFQLSKPTISETVRLLLKKSLVVKVKDPADGRAYYLELSAAGKKMVSNASTFSQPILGTLNQLESEQQTDLYKYLLDLLTLFQKGGLIPPQRMCSNCRHFTQHDGSAHCSLLKLRLETADLRVDCPEFEQA